MDITSVRIRRISNSTAVVAVCSITLDDSFAINDIKIVEGSQGLFIDMPSKKLSNGTYRDIAHPVNAQTRAIVQEQLFQAYEQAVKEDKNVLIIQK